MPLVSFIFRPDRTVRTGPSLSSYRLSSDSSQPITTVEMPSSSQNTTTQEITSQTRSDGNPNSRLPVASASPYGPATIQRSNVKAPPRPQSPQARSISSNDPASDVSATAALYSYSKSAFESTLEEFTHTWYGNSPRGNNPALPTMLVDAINTNFTEPSETYLNHFATHWHVMNIFPPTAWKPVTSPSDSEDRYAGIGIPALFYPVAEDYLYFHTTCLYPYFLELNGKASETPDPRATARHRFRDFNNGRRAAMINELSFGHLRWRSPEGDIVFKPSYVRLVEMFVRSCIVEQMRLVREGADDGKIWMVCHNSSTLLGQFYRLISRSERIEGLLMKYLLDPGCNMEVVEGIKEASRGYDEYIAAQMAPYEPTTAE
ncbi:hypothetical protein BJ508DRAFT_365882 [Ascobolus immersus RN42]|uniref:Uncharacterized protein n=1 Tax=Ascobolus immersus RN42 TaxID=1160509 RepID=A0A3N4HMW1_ASCIM|nr:hypothetical protein BJ508DRAFT_365882 [Ascobolus immersus RN42]